MFTGIIEEMGIFKRFDRQDICIEAKEILSDLKIGDSVAVNGVCLTVTSIKDNHVSFHVSPTTQKITQFQTNFLKAGQKINLERAATLNSRLGGHLVSGHVDGLAKIISRIKKRDAYLFELLYPPKIKPFLVDKGSITLDGISLTICEVLTSSFKVTVIPQTLRSTTLQYKNTGEQVHIEADLVARYLMNQVIVSKLL